MSDKQDPRAFADAFGEQDDSTPRRPPGRMVYDGVIIASRFNLASEYEQMSRAIDALPDMMVPCIESIWCDSKERDFSIGVKPNLFTPELPAAIAAAFRASGGHNGITI